MDNTKSIINKYKFEIISFISIFILIFAVYFHCSNFDFVHLDETILIQHKVQDMENISFVKKIIFSSVFDGIKDKFYRPVLSLTFLADTLICGGEPGFYHYSNILWHMFAVFLVFMLFRNMSYSKNVSMAAAAVFAVHPALVSAIAWVPGRNDILLAVFAIISFIFFIRGISNGKLSHIILSSVFFMIALFTKETVIVLPFICMLYAFFYGIKAGKKSIIQTIVCFTIAVILYAGFRHFVLSAGVQGITVYEMILNVIRSVKATFWYFAVAILTKKILVLPYINSIPAINVLFPAAVISMLCVFLRKHCNFNHILFGILWFVLFLLPTYVMPEDIFRTHRLYLPIAGCFIIIIEIIKAFNEKYAINKKWFYALFGLLIIAISLISYKQTFYYKDRTSFWFKAIAENPDASFVNIVMSGYYADAGDLNKSEEYALTALKQAKNQNIPRALLQLAEVYYKKNDMEKAEQYFSKALQVDKFKASGYLGLSKIYDNEGNKEAAINILEEAHKIIPQSKDIKRRLENLKEGKKEFSYVISWK